ncbi:alpha/beta hydrolase family esterase [Shimia sp. MMG029]|uniref:alpha/beta hydrolase family esterase n=1 Tax=Shimia sp. MMG029 TaxID=3021978 RepID=UPI0022FE17F2|nr:polyhydroxybutyrate depolymerase [Shimia sp. MMG029]MDA5556707.1 polyhydroxybutyrate depolymerase [Shimia sp. MMG029]
MIRLSFILAALLTATSASAMGPWKGDAPACGDEVACPLGTRSYHVMEPDGWDGESPMPVLLHFHGWSRNGIHPQRSERVGASTKRRGVLLVTPNGERNTWRFWQSDSEDVPFADAVLLDVARRYPIDPTKIYVSGYSFGSAMAWRFACQSGNDVAALLAVAGSIDQTETCPEAPGDIRHVHGLADTVMDFPMGPGNDVTYPVALWRRALDCATARMDQGDWQVRSFLTLSRTTWDCAQGDVTLDLHPGGHFIPHGWIGRQLDELLHLTPSYP